MPADSAFERMKAPVTRHDAICGQQRDNCVDNLEAAGLDELDQISLMLARPSTSCQGEVYITGNRSHAQLWSMEEREKGSGKEPSVSRQQTGYGRFGVDEVRELGSRVFLTSVPALTARRCVGAWWGASGFAASDVTDLAFSACGAWKKLRGSATKPSHHSSFIQTIKNNISIIISQFQSISPIEDE
ncbi:hypothetical protein B7463_g10169, partial [Scytalidium lignicola]